MGSYPSAAQLQNNIDNQFPRDALRFIQQRQITGRLFNWYDFGGYIEFYAPAIKTFADGRTDIFVYNGVLNDYININTIERPFELLDKYKIDYVLFPVTSPLPMCSITARDGTRFMKTKWRSFMREYLPRRQLRHGSL